MSSAQPCAPTDRTHDLEVVYADASLLVLNKPAGLLSVPGRGPDKQDALSTRAQACWPGARVVHRLDQATSGLIVMALGEDAQRALNTAFAQRRVLKRYIAVVHGSPSTQASPVAPPLPPAATATADNPVWQTIDLPLALDWPQRPRRIVHPTGKPSLTLWRTLGPDAPGRTRLVMAPQTGRSHQLRVHLAAIGHPIVGDRLYGPAADAAEPRLLLHAQALGLAHPLTGRWLDFVVPTPF